MKIIFLDFDGVINSFSTGRRNLPETKYKGLEAEAQELNPDLIGLLNKIIRITGAKVVVSSMWRLHRSKEELIEILEYRNFKGEVVDITPDFSGTHFNRSDEIEEWIDNCKDTIESFVILDDGYEEYLIEKFKNNFILIEKSNGLNKYHVKKAIQILGAK